MRERMCAWLINNERDSIILLIPTQRLQVASWDLLILKLFILEGSKLDPASAKSHFLSFSPSLCSGSTLEWKQIELDAGVKMVLAKEMLCVDYWLVDGGSVSVSDNRPLVLNFGSCTWPSFLFKLDQFKGLIEDFSSIADFLIIYIEEAHASGTDRLPALCFLSPLLPRLGVGRGIWGERERAIMHWDPTLSRSLLRLPTARFTHHTLTRHTAEKLEWQGLAGKLSDILNG